MSDNQETHAKIVAEVRDISRCMKWHIQTNLKPYTLHTPLPTVYGKPLGVYFAELADRLEAATKWEREKLSSCYVRSTHEAAMIIVRSGAVNAAKMYKALVTIREKCVIYNNTIAEEIDAICGNAISEPARNCDVYDNPYDAADAWPENERCAGRRFHNQSCDGCGYSPARCVSRWLYEKAKTKDEVKG